MSEERELYTTEQMPMATTGFIVFSPQGEPCCFDHCEALIWSGYYAQERPFDESLEEWEAGMKEAGYTVRPVTFTVGHAKTTNERLEQARMEEKRAGDAYYATKTTETWEEYMRCQLQTQEIEDEAKAAQDATDERTETEKRFDELVAQRRRQGRQTYGKGLSWDDAKYRDKWPLMALEEALDGAQYLMAEVMRLEDEKNRYENALERISASSSLNPISLQNIALFALFPDGVVTTEYMTLKENAARMREALHAVVDWHERDESYGGFHVLLEDIEAALEGKENG